MGAIQELEAKQLREDLPDFKSGDTLRVHFRVVEGSRERIQVFQGTCIRRPSSDNLSSLRLSARGTCGLTTMAVGPRLAWIIPHRTPIPYKV